SHANLAGMVGVAGAVGCLKTRHAEGSSMQSTDFEMRAPLCATRRYARRGRALLGAVVLVVSAALSQGALAQDAEQPLSAFLPASTVFAVYAKSNQVAAEVAANIVGELDLAEAQRTLEK